MLRARRTCAAGALALVLGGFTLGRPASAGSTVPPTPADFVGYPSCMLYAVGADLRVRVRAPRAPAVCRRLPQRLGASGFRWSVRPRRLRRIVSPICLFADPRARLELQVIDDAVDSERGRRICAELARAGWFDLEAPS